ncbi:MAG: DUF3108 domain-containing protein [Gammaproteobacteria bacterium]|nr:DUF3108 domain-containing protein [Gammaproteobacteria bacterium]
MEQLSDSTHVIIELMLRAGNYRYSESPGIRALLALAALVFATIAADCRAQTVPSFNASYAVRYGVLRGEMTLDLRPEGDDRLMYNTMLRPRGFVTLFRRGAIEETSSLAISDGQLQPLVYRSRDTIARPHRNTEYRFDEPLGRVTGTYKSRAVDEEMRPGGHNRISVQVAVMEALNQGRELTEFAVFDRARWRDFKFEVVADQAADVPFGEFDTVEIRYSSSRKEKSWSLHCAPELGYVPVMIVFREDGKVKSRAELVSFTRLDAGDNSAQ